MFQKIDQFNNILLNSKNLYGESLKNTKKEIFPFIYGVRHDYVIINLKNITFFLKRIFKLIKFNIEKNNKILLIGNSFDIKFLLNKNLTKENKNIILFNKDWTNGLITNNIEKKLNNLIKKEKIKLIFIIKSSIDEKFLNKELSTLNIPIISILNTSQSLKNINYPIVTNTKNIKSLYTLMFLFRKIF